MSMPQYSVFITGATSGLGRGVATQLAAGGHTVLVHGRDRAKVDGLVAELGGDARGYVADLGSLDEVRRLADEVKANEKRVDVLVNNAGVASPERRDSRDGIELDFAVNHLAHWLLTGLLMPKIGDRVVNVASIGQAPIDWNDPLLQRGWESFRAYAQSKLAQIAFTFDLAEWGPFGGRTANALHPATLMDTQMVRQSFGRAMSTVEDGVGPVVRLAVGGDVWRVTGRFYDQMRESRAHEQAYDDDARERLHFYCAELAGEDPYAS
jgi:NAD(P)-dependent dehydrogenase (short-subunit alcohol dehydrogenase family)